MRFLLIFSKQLAKRARVLIHWKAALDNMRALEYFIGKQGILQILDN